MLQSAQGSQGGRYSPTNKWAIRRGVFRHTDYGITDKSAWYLLLDFSDLTCTCTRAHISVSLSVFLTHLLAACVHINFSLPDTDNALLAGMHIHTHAHQLTHTHPHPRPDKICKRRAAETGGVVLLLLSNLSESSDLCMIYESLYCLKALISNRPVVIWLFIAKVYSTHCHHSHTQKNHMPHTVLSAHRSIKQGE